MKYPKSCDECPLAGYGDYLKPQIVPNSDVILIIDRPTEEDCRKREWLSGNIGRVFSKLVWHGGWEDKGQLSICGLTQCSRGDAEGYEFCKPQLEAAIRDSGAKAVIAMGEAPFFYYTGQHNVLDCRGYKYSSTETTLPVVGTLAPDYLAYKKMMHMIPAVLYDIKVAPFKKQREFHELPLVLNPMYDDLQKFYERALSSEYLVVDIETPMSKGKPEEELNDENAPSMEILRVSFALPDFSSITVPYVVPFIDLISSLLTIHNDKVLYNYSFDIPRLKAKGHEVYGTLQDTLWLWHFLHPDLPRSLGHAASYYTDNPEWKSRSGSDPVLYSAVDAYATAKTYQGVRADLKAKGMWDIAQRHVTELLPVLYAMSDRGVRIDKEKVECLRKEIDDECAIVQAELDSLVPQEVRQYSPKGGYKKTPKCTEGLVQATFVDSKTGVEVVRWAKLLPFKANSTKQVQHYMELTGQEVPYDRRQRRFTTGKKDLKRLTSKDKVYETILRYRELKKFNVYLNWPIGADGRVHSRFLPIPSTGRLSSSNPNFQNIPKETLLGDAFRDCIVASPGCVLERFDFSAFEAIITGWFAGDPDFMALATKGIYTYVLAKYLKLDISVSDPELKEKLLLVKGANKKLYRAFKSAVLGWLYGMKFRTLFQNNPGVFESENEARKILNFLCQLFPKVTAWQKQMVQLATKQSYLMTPFNYIRWFWDLPNGEDGPKAIAQMGQSCAAAICKQVMLDLSKTWMGQYLVAQIHDELIFDVPENLADRLREEALQIATRPIKELGGLRFEVVSARGKSLKG